MESDKPDEGPDPRARLEAARGDLRDALGSVRNLAQLLHSVRVGPRAIESVLPDVRDSCARIGALSRTVLDTVAGWLPERKAADELLAWMLPRAEALEAELARSSGKPVNAKTRLALEHAVTGLSRDLEAARALIDLLDDATRGNHVQLALADLLRTGAAARDDVERVEARAAPGLGREVTLNPRACSLVMGVGARLVSDAGRGKPLIRLESGPSGQQLVVESSGAAGDAVSLPTLPLVGPTLGCVEAAARACGARALWEPDVPRFALLLPG